MVDRDLGGPRMSVSWCRTCDWSVEYNKGDRMGTIMGTGLHNVKLERPTGNFTALKKQAAIL
jgi:hypothetical protein